MSAAALISLALNLLQVVLSSAGIKGLAPEVAANIEAAIASLLAVQGSDVTYQQLEGLRVEPKW